MGGRAIQSFLILLGFLFFSGTLVRGTEHALFSSQTEQLKTKENLQKNKPTSIQTTRKISHNSHRVLLSTLKPLTSLPKTDVVTPITTVPVINPSSSNPNPNPNPTITTNPTYNYPSYNPSTTPSNPIMTPVTTPTMATPSTPMSSSGGQSWCIATQSAAQTALQVALDYACGYGGADCSAIQQGGSCFNPDTVRDHASYAFNNYYQKNPIPTSCDFGGTAVLSSVDPSSSTCQYESTSTSSSILNTTNPTGSDIYGSSVPPSPSGARSTQNSIKIFVGFMCLLVSSVSISSHKPGS